MWKARGRDRRGQRHRLAARRWRQRKGDVMHLVANRLSDPAELLQGVAKRSRDFR